MIEMICDCCAVLSFIGVPYFGVLLWMVYTNSFNLMIGANESKSKVTPQIIYAMLVF